MHLGGNHRWVPLILAWHQAPQWGKKAKHGVRYEKYGQAKRVQRVATLSPPQITSPFVSLAYFFPIGESGPGFKYDFINRLPLPRFFSSFSKRAGREYPSTLVKKCLKIRKLTKIKS